MNKAPDRRTPSASEPEPAWDVAYLFPAQGFWSEQEYLALAGNHLVEFARGRIEVLPMPTTAHQLLVACLYGLLTAFAAGRGAGTVLFAPLRIRLWARKYREPDIVFLLKEHADRMGDAFWTGADLVMEVVSPDPEDRRRDLETKRKEYARAGIPEYWIVDPQLEQILVLRLEGKRYVAHGEFPKGTTATSPLLPGFTADVTTVFASQVVGGAAKKSRSKRQPRQ